MKGFLIRLSIFLIPILVLILVPISILIYCGENFDRIDSKISTNQDFLIGYVYNEKNYGYLKWTSILKNQRKDVLALGSSRVLQFREEMFDSSFYNAGYTISSIKDFLLFLKDLKPSKYPKILIIGIDQWMFNHQWETVINTKSKRKWKNNFQFLPSLSTIKSLGRDILNGKISPIGVYYSDRSNKTGINAVLNDTGFRNDGSMQYGLQIEKLLNNDSTANDFGYSDTFERILNGNKRFQYGDSINTLAIKEVDKLLKFCSLNEIFVVGFLPPFSNSVFYEMKKTGNYTYIEKIYPSLLPIFEKYGNEIWDMTNPNEFNTFDYEFIDGFHGSEVTYQKILISIIEQNSIMSHYSNLGSLKNSYSNKKNKLEIY